MQSPALPSNVKHISFASTSADSLFSCKWADVSDVSESEDDVDDLLPESHGVPETAGVAQTIQDATVNVADLDGSQRAWRPNAEAPEFIPTLTMTCPLVGVIASEGVQQGFFDEVLRVPHTPKRTRRRARKPQLTPLEIPARSPEAAGGELPEASEEQWQHRAEMRRTSVALVKATSVYEWYNMAKPRETWDKCEPMTPDPLDRTISRRQWRGNVERWRQLLQELYMEEGDGGDDRCSLGTASTETGSATHCGREDVSSLCS